MSEINKSQEEFLSNFNWHNFEEGIEAVDEKNLQEFEELVAKTFIATDQEEVAPRAGAPGRSRAGRCRASSRR